MTEEIEVSGPADEATATGLQGSQTVSHPTMREIANQMFDESLCMDGITWLAGGVANLTDDDFLMDVIAPASDGDEWLHESMSVFRDMPEWALSDAEGFQQWIIDKNILGFVVSVSTPKPVKFHPDGGFMSYSFGMTVGTYIYVENVIDAVPLAVEWQERTIERLRAEASARAQGTQQ